MTNLSNNCDCCKYFNFDSLKRFSGLEYPLYYILTKSELNQVEYIKPKQYIHNIAQGFGGLSYQDAIANVNQEKVKQYSDAMKNGDKFDIGYYTEGKGSQEGRHRVLALIEIGCDSMPVVKIKQLNKDEVNKIYNALKTYSREKLDRTFKRMGYNGITDLDYKSLINYKELNENNMKDFIKKRLTEELSFNIVESLLDEDYPLTFNMEHFKTLRSFAERVRYCEEHLQRISSGSSRIVYKIDNEKVLKLAKNQKGIAQCEVEIDYSQYRDLDDVVAKIFDSDENNLWNEMELARKVSVGDFIRITGFRFSDYQTVIGNYGVDVNGRGYKRAIKPEIPEAMWENEWTYEILNFIGNYGVPTGDLQRLNSYGIVKRDGQDHIVIIDYGLTSDVYNSYYS